MNKDIYNEFEFKNSTTFKELASKYGYTYTNIKNLTPKTRLSKVLSINNISNNQIDFIVKVVEEYLKAKTY